MSSKGVLILGETGSGKSTFINTITNYFRNGSLQDLRIAIPTMYFHATEEFQNNESNTRDPTISQTDSCITYSFTQDGMRFSFVDTPGLNDSRGTKQDELNIDKILAAAHNEKDLSAILLVINATQPRINPALKAVFVSLKGNIPNSVLDNTVVVLTKTREDTTAFQRSVLAEVAPNLQRNSIFYMDNTAFVSKPKNGRLIKSDILNAEWKTSMKTCSKIVDRISAGDRSFRYGLAANKNHPRHPHFYCTLCGSMECLNPESLPVDIQSFQKTFPSLIEKMEIRLDGICKNCLRRGKIEESRSDEAARRK